MSPVPRRFQALASPRRLLVGLAAALLAAGCSPGYVLQAGWEEAKLLESARPIEAAIRDTTTPPELRNKLRLVLDARDFAERSLGLRPGDAFTSYAALDRDTLLLVVSAAPRFELRWKTWWFPIVGSVPYKGFFDFERARAAAGRLRAEGYDVYVRPAAAFSTLGWFPDPVLSTTLDADSVAVVETVVHEITHTTWFPSGHADFSESFATFAGHAGAIAFFCEALRDEARCATARGRWHDTRVFGSFITALRERLAELYAMDLPAEEMTDRKREALAEAAERFAEEVAPRFEVFASGRLDPAALDNAWLLSRVLYYGRLDDFEAIREREGSARGAIQAVLEAARAAPRPWEGVDRLLGLPEG